MQAIMKSTELKFNITNCIRNLEVLQENLKDNEEYHELYSEITYWISSLELIRNYIIKENCYSEDFLELMSIKESSIELLDEMSAAFLIASKFLREDQLKTLSVAINYCKKVKETL